MKRFIAILMTLCMVLGLSSISVWAAEEATWQEETPMPTARYGLSSSVVENKIYVIGGIGGTHTVEIYDTQTDTWSTGQSMPTARTYLSSSVVGNKIYVIGGTGTNANILEIYDTQTDTWSTGQSMPTARSYLSSSVVGNKIYTIGGAYPGGVDAINTVEIYDTQTDTWSTGQSMPTATRFPTSSVVDDKIYVIGGTGASVLDTVEIYDTQTDTWTIGQSMPTKRYALSSSVVGDKIYAIGGCGNTSGSPIYNVVEIYDTKTNTWSTGQSMSISRFVLTSSVVGDKIYAIGGCGANKESTSSMEILQVGSTETTSRILSVLLNEGESAQLSTSYNLENNANYTWSSTNEAVAKVDSNGKVTAVAAGDADIYAQNADGTFKEYIPVKVVEAADELRLAVHLKIGEKAKLYLTDDAAQVTWSSLDDSVATISSDGQVTGVKKGLAIVKAVLDGQTYQIYVRVNG